MENKQANLLDALISELDCKNDARLSRKMDMSPSSLCQMRAGTRVIGPAFIVKAHELTGIPVKVIKQIGGLE